MIHSIVDRIFRQRQVLTTMLLTTLCMASALEATEFVQVIHGPKAAPLEKLAANELADTLGRVFDDIDVRTGSVITRRAGTIFFVGNPDTNPGIARNNFKWPKVTDQGIVIVSNDEQKIHAVGGRSPAATLWAVYELGHQLGIRYLLRGDVDPLHKRSFDLSDIEFTIEPQVRQRGWETIGAGAHSFESWGLSDHQRLIGQLAKMRFNHLILKIEPWHPFLQHNFEGVTKTTGTFWYGRKYALTGDIVGKKAFGGAKFFSHPTFAETNSPADRIAAQQHFLASLIDSARSYGMTVSVQLRRSRFAPEFAKALKGSSSKPRLLSISPTVFREVATSWFGTYPGLDQVSWLKSRSANRRFGIVACTQREAAETSIPVLDRNRTVAINKIQIPAPTKDSRLSLAIHSPTLDMLPQTHSQEVQRTLQDAVKAGWSSVSVGPSTVNEFSQDIHYVSRAMWDLSVDPATSHKDLWATTTGNESASDRLWLGRQHLEQASSLILANDPDLVNLGPGMLIKRHYIAEPIPAWWQEATDAYTQYMIELYRAQGAVDGGAKPILFYYAKRGEFVLEYLGAVKSVREAALAEKAGDTEKAIEHLEVALESTYNCINTLADVARNQGDRGLIAVLNADAYRPLVAELERLLEEEN